MQNRYGVTPWGSWFINVLDSYQMGERLDRGRRYANAGKVYSLEFDDCRATAMVEGHYQPFYRVEIRFPRLKEAEQVYQLIEGDPPLLARIAAGELPESFLQKLKKKGIDLIPRRWQDMERTCTCPDWGDPCKHMAALYYVIAREIDANPHALFRLRGIDLAKRFGKSAVHRIAPPFTIKYAKKETPPAAQFPPEQAPLEFEEIPHCQDLITSLLPPAPPFCEKDFALVLSEFYHRCAHYQAWESAGEQAETEHYFSRSRWTVLCSSPGPGARLMLQSEDIYGIRKQYSPCDAFEYFVHFSSDDGTASYSFLFRQMLLQKAAQSGESPISRNASPGLSPSAGKARGGQRQFPWQ
jgi:uncharacterized Zn finger protein